MGNGKRAFSIEYNGPFDCKASLDSQHYTCPYEPSDRLFGMQPKKLNISVQLSLLCCRSDLFNVNRVHSVYSVYLLTSNRSLHFLAGVSGRWPVPTRGWATRLASVFRPAVGAPGNLSWLMKRVIGTVYKVVPAARLTFPLPQRSENRPPPGACPAFGKHCIF